jgi:glycosyl transferase family 2
LVITHSFVGKVGYWIDESLNAADDFAAVQAIGVPVDGYVEYWSESHVSEDFDIALRLQTAGNIIRMAAYHDNEFKEGVSLTIYDELTRWEK